MCICVCVYVYLSVPVYIYMSAYIIYLSLAKLVGKAHWTLSQFILFLDGLYSMSVLFTEYNLVKSHPIYKQTPMKT